MMTITLNVKIFAMPSAMHKNIVRMPVLRLVNILLLTASPCSEMAGQELPEEERTIGHRYLHHVSRVPPITTADPAMSSPGKNSL
jgi:hypothetical protein